MDPVIREWSRKKHILLSKYLNAYTKIMNSQQRNRGWPVYYCYVDAFAGPVYYRDRDDDEAAYAEGSPAIALAADPPFSRYVFIEIRPDRVKNLELLRTQWPGRYIEIVQEDCNKTLVGIARQIRTDKAHALVFLDPYGLQVDWATVEELSYGSFDVFVNFPIMALNRALLRREGRLTGTQLSHLQRVMGDSGLIQEVYIAIPDFFEEERLQRSRLPAERLASKYRDRLRERFGNVSSFTIMRNSKGGPLYALFLASRNSTAVRIANDIFRKV